MESRGGARSTGGDTRDVVVGLALPAPNRIERSNAAAILALTLARLGEQRVAVAVSFSAEDMVILDLLREINARPRIFTIDTGRLPRATHDLAKRATDHFEIEVQAYAPDEPTVAEMIATRGVNLFYRSADERRLCCSVRRVEPLQRALAGAAGWITGLRREESPARAGTPKIARDPAYGGIWKIAPLADWSAADVWRHVEEHRLPYNRLYDLGYKSIGCDPCTRAVGPGDDPRSGRWWWEEAGDRECGMHTRTNPISGP